MKKDYKFLTKKIILTAASVGLAVMLTGCPELESFLSEKQNSTTDKTYGSSFATETIHVTEHSDTTQTTTSSLEQTTTTTKIIPTGVEDYYEDVIPTINSSIDTQSDQFFYSVLDCKVDFYGSALGFDNPKMAEMFKKITNNYDLNLSEVGFFQDSISRSWNGSYSEVSYYKRQQEPCNLLYSSISAYILSKNNERQFIDEIRTSFINENFHEYFDKVNEEGKESIIDDELRKILSECSNLNEFVNKIKENNLDSKLEEYLSELIVYSCIDYNELRGKLVYCYNTVQDNNNNKKVLYVTQGTTPDGRHVLLPNQRQYDYLISDLQFCKCLSDVKNLYEPITEENLRNGGLDYDLYEHYFNDVLSIDFNIDNSKYVYQQEDSNTRSRTS